MNLVIQEAVIIDSQSPFHNQKVSLKIENGSIVQIQNDKILVPAGFEELHLPDLCISPGWFDCSVSLGEPGFEERETIVNGLGVAAKSGFTAVAVQPNTFPVTDNQSAVYFKKSKAIGHIVDLYPIGSLTKNAEGKDMAELYDMKNAGAIAFGDYNKSLSDGNVLKIALQYAQDFNGLVIAFSQDEKIKGNGVVNEGINSTYLGLKGIPALAEEIQVSRNLFLLEYTGGRLHIPTISTQKSVALIKEAKQKGMNVTCSVAVHHLVLTDDVLSGFDSRYKVLPPLRTESDRKALIDAVLDGTIDCITSDHNPIDIEFKKLEFDYAKNGTIGLESAFVALQTVLPTEVIVEKLTAAKSIFGIENNLIALNEKANLTLFTTKGDSIFEKKNILSASQNSAFLGQKIKGKVYGVYNNNQLKIN